MLIRRPEFSLVAVRLLSFLLGIGTVGQGALAQSKPAEYGAGAGEARAVRAFEAAKAAKASALALQEFLEKMPKGADLHMHLSGAVYAETFLGEAVKQGLCVDPAALKLTQPTGAACVNGDLPASAILQGPAIVEKTRGMTGQQLYDALVDSFSMRGFVPTSGITGHDQFFATFNRFGGLKDYSGEWLDEVATRAAAQNEQYLEVMQTPPFSRTAALGYKFGWPEGAGSISNTQLAALRSQLLQAGLRDDIAADVREFADAKARRSEIEHCDIYEKYEQERRQYPDARDAPRHGKIAQLEEVNPGCNVQIRFL